MLYFGKVTYQIVYSLLNPLMFEAKLKGIYFLRMDKLTLILISAIMFSTAPLCLVLGYFAGKRQGAKKFMNEHTLDMSGLSPQSRDKLVGWLSLFQAQDKAKRNRWANWMFKKYVHYD